MVAGTDDEEFLTMEPTSRPPRYATLRDYLRVLRRYSVPIILVAAIGAGIGLADAKRQANVYQATSSVSFQDPAQDLPLVGLGTSFIQSPAALASTNAETLTRPQIMARVRQNLRTRQSTSALSTQLSGSVSSAGLLNIAASSASPRFASRLANSVAAVVVAEANTTARAGFAAAAAGIKHQIADLQHGPKQSSPATASELQTLEAQLGRLQTLSTIAQTAQVAQLAQAPQTPISPKPVRSAIIGLVLGLVLAILLAFLRDTMDRRLRTAHDIEESFAFPMLGSVRARAMGKVVQREALKDHDFRADVEAFRILRRNLEFLNPDSPPRSVVVTSGVPEEGKTTVAASLAFSVALAGKRTLLVDCDLRRPDLATRLEMDRSPGLTDFLAGDKASTEITHRIALGGPASPNGTAGAESVRDAPQLDFVPSGSPTSQAAELLGSKRFKNFLEHAVSTYDLVVIDSSPLLPVADTLEMLPAVDAVLICAREAKTRRDEAAAVTRTLDRFPGRPVGVVVTAVKPGRGDYEVYSYSYSAYSEA